MERAGIKGYDTQLTGNKKLPADNTHKTKVLGLQLHQSF